jgi:hypothetical protein
MLMDNNIFTIDISTSHSDLANVHKDVLKNIDKIETIELKQDEQINSSALLSLLFCIKNSKPNIKIPLIDEQNSFINGLGKFSIVK